MARERRRSGDDARIGPISVLALIAILSMAVLAVLAISTANASLQIAERQAESVKVQYENELAAQDFLAELDASLAAARSGSAQATSVVQSNLPQMLDHAEKAANGRVSAAGVLDGSTVVADFTQGDGKSLHVEVEVSPAGKYSLSAWQVTVVENEAQPQGSLYQADR